METEAYAGRLYESLTHQLLGAQIFMDVDSLRAGEDFVERLNHALSSSRVELVIIGRQWLTVADELGRPRLNDEADFVRQEMAKALERGLTVPPDLTAVPIECGSRAGAFGIPAAEDALSGGTSSPSRTPSVSFLPPP